MNEFQDYLLYGYDMVKNPLGDAASIKFHPILDRDKLQKAPKKWYSNLSGSNEFVHNSFIGKSEYEVAETISASTGIGGKNREYSLSVNCTASKGREYTQNSVYGKIRSTRKISEYAQQLTKEELGKCMDSMFVSYAAMRSCEEVFETYGTHLIMKFSIGGKLTIDFQTKSEVVKDTSSIKADAQAAYMFITGSVSGSYEKNARQFAEECNYVICGKGGDPIILNSNVANANFESWSRSVEKNPALYEVAECIPIWEICESPAIKNKLMNGYYKYYNKELEARIHDIRFINSVRVDINAHKGIENRKMNTEIVTRFDNSYHGEYADLNKGAEGDFIYLLYTLGAYDEQKITDIKLISSNDSAPCILPEYKRVDGDLNRHVRGKYIYVTYLMGNEPTGYQALGVRTTTIPISEDWHLITDSNGRPIDMNEGAGGEYLYLFGYVDPLLKNMNQQITQNKKAITGGDNNGVFS